MEIIESKKAVIIGVFLDLLGVDQKLSDQISHQKYNRINIFKDIIHNLLLDINHYNNPLRPGTFPYYRHNIYFEIIYYEGRW